MNRWLSLIPLVVMVALAALFIGWSLKRDPAIKPDALVGRPIPETVLPMLEGDRAGAGHLDLKTAGVGRPMLVNVFASWCLPCRAEHPKLMALKARGVPFVFSTGYGAAGLSEAWRGHPTVQKPFTESAVRNALMQAMGVGNA